MDRFEQITNAASYTVAVFGNPVRGEFSFFDLTKGTPFPVENIQREIAERSMVFCGVMGVVQGIPCTALAEPLSGYAIRALSHAFNERVEATSKAALASPADDSIGWCERLHWLPDTRD